MEKRAAGILCPVFSLPGSFGIGQLGKEAFKFIDFLSDSGFSAWQILPLHPVDSENSPYSSSSAFAGYSAFIDLDELVHDGLLLKEELPLPFLSKRVNYYKVEEILKPVFKKLHHEFQYRANKHIFKEIDAFKKEHRYWLTDYSIFSALKDHFQGKKWSDWPSPFKYFSKIKKSDLKGFEEQISYHQLIQFLFFRQWMAVKNYATKKGISIIGDMPIYVSYDSADVWSHPELFKLNRALKPTQIAGVPPDFFSEDGQLWGFPIYNWKNHKNTGFKWWKERSKHLLKINDQVRFDHFRALESYWSVPGKDKTAKNGKWIKAPGDELLAVLTKIKSNGLIAENLGDISEKVEALRLKYQIPGMKIFQFAFGGHIHSEHLPHNCDQNDIYYSGTHDNDVLKSWLKTLSDGAVNHLISYYGIERKTLSTRWLIDRILASSPRLVIIPVQDFLELGAESRVNIPGTVSPQNWSWRLNDDYTSINPASDTSYRLDFFGRKRI